MTPVHALKRFVPLVGVVLVVGCGYNTIQTYDEQVNAAAAQIKVQLQRRADLIPNLVETVRPLRSRSERCLPKWRRPGPSWPGRCRAATCSRWRRPTGS